MCLLLSRLGAVLPCWCSGLWCQSAVPPGHSGLTPFLLWWESRRTHWTHLHLRMHSLWACCHFSIGFYDKASSVKAKDHDTWLHYYTLVSTIHPIAYHSFIGWWMHLFIYFFTFQAAINCSACEYYRVNRNFSPLHLSLGKDLVFLNVIACK